MIKIEKEGDEEAPKYFERRKKVLRWTDLGEFSKKNIRTPIEREKRRISPYGRGFHQRSLTPLLKTISSVLGMQ